MHIDTVAGSTQDEQAAPGRLVLKHLESGDYLEKSLEK